MASSNDGIDVSFKRYVHQRSTRGNGASWEASEALTDRTGRHPAGRSTTYGRLRSTVGTPCRTEFVNRADVALRVLWLDFQGEKVEYSVMAPGASYRGLLTYSTHPWVLEDCEGTVYAVYVGGSATVTVHGRDSFTVVSGTQRRSASAKDSIRSRVVELLKNGSTVDGKADSNAVDSEAKDACKALAKVGGSGEKQAAGSDWCRGDDDENCCDPKAVQMKSAEKSAMRTMTRGFLGWCVPKAEELMEVDEERTLQRDAEKVKDDKLAHGCSICCDNLEQDVWVVACGHVFHGHCLAAACERSLECPVCRQEIAGEMDLRKIYLS